MSDNQLIPAGAVITATVHVTRKATGITETYQLVGTVPREQDDKPVEPKKDDES
jgi:hypothetical protein